MHGAIFWWEQRDTPTPTHSQVFPVRDSISTFAIIALSGAIRQPTKTKDKTEMTNKTKTTEQRIITAAAFGVIVFALFAVCVLAAA